MKENYWKNRYKNRKEQIHNICFISAICQICGIELTNENWYISLQVNRSCICKKCSSIKNKRYREEHTIELKQKREKNKERTNTQQRNRRLKIIKYYSNDTMQCNCCGEKEIKFLQIDHIDCGHAMHGKNKRPNNFTGPGLYGWLIKNDFPNGYQILCANCNFAKGMYGICPHKIKKEI